MSEALKLKPQIEIKLVIQKGPHAGQRFSFSKKEIMIGRSPENDIVLLNDPLISRQHAKVIVIGTDVEIINLSQKNLILVQGEAVQKWKLINSGTFTVGDTEFQIQFDLGQSVVPVQPTPSRLQVVKPPQEMMIKPTALATAPHKTLQHQQFQQQSRPYTAPKALAPTSFLSNPKARFYLILAIVAVAAYFYFNSATNKAVKIDKKSILKYEDEISIKLNSKNEKESLKKIEKLYELKNSPTALRAEENFIKGMRDYQLANYSRAQEFFQVVLNLQPDHVLAKRHVYLSKVRFDEVLKAKLMLGESYYQKHNFKMCQSLYEQVLNMLQGKSSDQNFQLATAMVEKCKFASEGIR